jgi:glycosyltransferase involved in cell wall biosynthesis
MKILFYASYPNISIGYSRIANILTNFLASKGHQIYYFGISNFKINTIDRFIHPNIILIDALEEEIKKGNDELYGVNSICEQIQIINPDILFLYNDIIVISRIFNNFIKYKINIDFKIFTYLDLVYSYEKIELVKHINNYSDVIFVFTNYWKENLISMGVNKNKIEILPHGFDSNIFYPLEQMECRKYFGFKPDDFIILNSNRNSYRKSIDKTISVFINFLKLQNLDKKIKLFLNMGIDDNYHNYDIIEIIKIECIKNDIDANTVLNNHIFIKSSNTLTDQELNILYNCCNIGINTCIGEGFGLCNLEHGGIGKPQIITNTGGLSDIFNLEYSTLINPVDDFYIFNQLDYHGGYGHICLTEDFVNGINKYYNDSNLMEEHGNKAKLIIRKNYNWDIILEKFNNDIICKYNECNLI